LNFDATSSLTSSKNEAIEYFAKRDLLQEKVEPINSIWQLSDVQKILKKQQPDGSWKYPGKKTVVYPKHHHSLLETWKQFRLLVERYELTKDHPAATKAAEFIFSCQTEDGDIRGLLGNQYATYYTGAIMAVLIKAGYEDDPRIEKGFKWLLSKRQNDGGWTIPILTHKSYRKAMYKLTSQYAEPVEPDRSKPFSHNWTDMALRAFAVHPKYRKSNEAKIAANLLKSRFFHPDSYSSYRAATYWIRFLFWWPNLITALNSLSLMSFSKDDPDIQKALNWLIDNQESNGLWKTKYVKGKKEIENKRNKECKLWISLAISRIFKRFYG
jgi:prenyltransferase beta subunit